MPIDGAATRGPFAQRAETSVVARMRPWEERLAKHPEAVQRPAERCTGRIGCLPVTDGGRAQTRMYRFGGAPLSFERFSMKRAGQLGPMQIAEPLQTFYSIKRLAYQISVGRLAPPTWRPRPRIGATCTVRSDKREGDMTSGKRHEKKCHPRRGIQNNLSSSVYLGVFHVACFYISSLTDCFFSFSARPPRPTRPSRRRPPASASSAWRSCR